MAHYAVLQARTDLSRREMKLYEAKGSAVPASGLSVGLVALGSGKGFICSLSHSLQFCAAPSLAQSWCLLTQVKRTFSLSVFPSSVQYWFSGGRRQKGLFSKYLWRQSPPVDWALWEGTPVQPMRKVWQIVFLQFTSHNKFMFHCEVVQEKSNRLKLFHHLISLNKFG